MDRLAVRRLRQEVMALQCLDHPYVIAVHDFLEDSQGFYVVTDMVRGGDLLDRLHTKVGRYSVQVAGQPNIANKP